MERDHPQKGRGKIEGSSKRQTGAPIDKVCRFRTMGASKVRLNFVILHQQYLLSVLGNVHTPLKSVKSPFNPVHHPLHLPVPFYAPPCPLPFTSCVSISLSSV